MKVERLVLDSNVLISAALSRRGPSFRVLDLVIERKCRLVFSHETFLEFETRLNRQKFDKYVNDVERSAHLSQVMKVSDWIAPTGDPMGCRDADDDAILDVALTGGVDSLVTGDLDLLVMHPFRGIPILRPADFLAQIEGET